MRTEIPTAICENDAAEKARMIIANNSQRIAPEFLFMACASRFFSQPAYKLRQRHCAAKSDTCPERFLPCKHWNLEYVAIQRNFGISNLETTTFRFVYEGQLRVAPASYRSNAVIKTQAKSQELRANS
jgi:hypothetical protein